MAAKSPEEVDAQFERCLNAGDVDGVVALYEPQATFVGQEGPPAIGHAAIRAAVAAFAAMKPKLKMGGTKIVPATANLAVSYNDWSMTATGPDGAPLALSGKATEIVRRQPDGSWLFVLDDPNMRG